MVEALDPWQQIVGYDSLCKVAVRGNMDVEQGVSDLGEGRGRLGREGIYLGCSDLCQDPIPSSSSSPSPFL